MQIFYAHAVQRHMIQLHSSLVDFQGHGILFLGPSGIGKTTQAEFGINIEMLSSSTGILSLFRRRRKTSWDGEPRGMDPPRTVRIRTCLYTL